MSGHSISMAVHSFADSDAYWIRWVLKQTLKLSDLAEPRHNRQVLGVVSDRHIASRDPHYLSVGLPEDAEPQFEPLPVFA